MFGEKDVIYCKQVLHMFSGSTDIENSIFRDKKSPFDYESDDRIVRKYRLSRPLIAKWMNFAPFYVPQGTCTLYQLIIGTKKFIQNGTGLIQLGHKWISNGNPKL